MTTIKDILVLDFNEDIKNVIDLEDRSEAEIQQEIESYIVTEGIGKHLGEFSDEFTSNIKETGVWLSGFYGSGKSYFGKMLGYIIDNPIINGTPARERFIPRLKGVTDASLIENSIRNLDKINSRVVFLDVAKQNTERGLAFTLFANLLKNLGLRDDIYGYMEFDLLIDGKLDELKAVVQRLESEPWDELKKSNRRVAGVMRRAYIEMGDSEDDYEDTKNIYSAAIDDFSASKFKEALNRYFKFNSDETLVFIFDEASEAISQRKFTLLDLEGISEALSSVSNKVWTIAIAQEKLDDVINNANISRSNLIKVTDRFKTKIHLESTEVDIIIRSRLLKKTEQANADLLAYYKKNEGLISDATNLKSSFPTITESADDFAIYYPFHKYQFDILQKFLFSSNALVATQVAARGMIITTFDILRKQMRDKELYAFTRGFEICDQAQTAPPIDLVNKYDTAKKTLRNSDIEVDGEQLLKTIHLLSDSEVVEPNLDNITKSFISDITSYYDYKPKIESALGLLLDAKVLLSSNNNYKITSDLEGKMLEEMNSFDIELFRKKRELTKHLIDYKIFSPVASYSDGSDSFKFNVETDSGEVLVASNDKALKLIIYSLFNINEDRQDVVEQLKLDTQYQKDTITLIPKTSDFSKIDKLIGEVERYKHIEDKYSNEKDINKRQIVRQFQIIREEKQRALRGLIEDAYYNATLVYMYSDELLNIDGFKSIINTNQQSAVKNVFTKRLSNQLSENLVPKIFSTHKESISDLFTANDFQFFDKNGNFVGDNLKVVEELNAKIKARYIDGKSLESEFLGAPWGYSYGTLAASLAALLRAGRLSVKFNNDTYFSHDEKAVHEAFTNTTKFKSASFKSITANLTATQKSQAVQLLMDLSAQDYIDKKVDWNINDFDLAESISALATYFIGAINSLHSTEDNFDGLFPAVVKLKTILQPFSGKVIESNYIDKVELLLGNKDEFSNAIKTILKTQKFVKNNLPKVKGFQQFIDDVKQELAKADSKNVDIEDASQNFDRLFKQDIVKNFGELQQQVQVVKDAYYKLVKTASEAMSHEYRLLQGKVDEAQRELQKYPAEPNQRNLQQLDSIKNYVDKRVVGEPALGYSTNCSNSGYSLSDILNYTIQAPLKDNELLILKSGFIKELPPQPDVSELVSNIDSNNESDSDQYTPPAPKKPRKVAFNIPSRVMTVQDYKTFLSDQLRALASAKPEDEIELEIEIQD